MDVDGGDIKVNLRIGQDDVKPRLEQNNALAEELKKALESGTPIRIGGQSLSRSSAEGLAVLAGGGGGATVAGGWRGASGGGPLASLGPTVMRTGDRPLAPLGPTVMRTGEQPLAPLGQRGPMRWAAGYDPKEEGEKLGGTFRKLNAVGMAYAARLAMSAGPGGIIGAGIGAGIGSFGGGAGMHAGAVLGGSFGESALNAAALANPAGGVREEMARRDLTAMVGRQLTGFQSVVTNLERNLADLIGGGAGSSIGAAPVPGLGQRIGGPEDIYRKTLEGMLSQTPPANFNPAAVAGRADSERGWRTAAGAGGALAGGEAGAAIGSLIFPGVGTVIGGVIGAVGGAWWAWDLAGPSQPQVAH